MTWTAEFSSLEVPGTDNTTGTGINSGTNLGAVFCTCSFSQWEGVMVPFNEPGLVVSGAMRA